MVRYEDARQIVIAQAELGKCSPSKISLPVCEALGYVLAEEISMDRAYPPFDRSTRDGYAVRASEAIPGKTLRCVGEIKAGDAVTEVLAAWNLRADHDGCGSSQRGRRGGDG